MLITVFNNKKSVNIFVFSISVHRNDPLNKTESLFIHLFVFIIIILSGLVVTKKI